MQDCDSALKEEEHASLKALSSREGVKRFLTLPALCVTTRTPYNSAFGDTNGDPLAMLLQETIAMGRDPEQQSSCVKRLAKDLVQYFSFGFGRDGGRTTAMSLTSPVKGLVLHPSCGYKLICTEKLHAAIEQAASKMNLDYNL